MWLKPFWGCPLRQKTGIPCLACGLTRAFDYTAHLRIGDAFAVTPLGVLGAVLELCRAHQDRPAD